MDPSRGSTPEGARTPEADLGTADQISGIYTMAIMDSLEKMLSAEDLLDFLARAGETRTVEELRDLASWTSFDQFKRLLQEASSLFDSPFQTSGVGVDDIDVSSATVVAEIMQAFDSPGAVLRAGEGTNPMVPMRRYEATELAPNEWLMREQFIEGFAPYPEFCSFVAGLYAGIPMYFGLPAADVIEEECQCRGDSACLFRLRWEEEDDETSRGRHHDVHTKLLEARFDQLKQMITDLASNERYEDVLQGIVRSTMRAVIAGGAILALEARPGSLRKVYSEGLTEVEADALAEDLLEGVGPERAIAVDVTSVRAHYGVLAIDERGGIFASQAHGTLETYAQLAAAALDAANAMEEARHQANTARVLLQLSTSLAEIVGTEEMAAKVARAVPDVIDCDRAAVFLDNLDWHGAGDGNLALVASIGFPENELRLLGSTPFLSEDSAVESDYGLLHTSRPSEVGNVASVAAPITSSGKVIGHIVAEVTTEPQRLLVTPRLAERLKGLAAQASIAISNARLVDQIRFQALHDPLTGLPNRSLILDRIEQMLARARRTNVATAALFIDLDGFKGVNDTLGHAVGDQLLRAVTARLAVTMRESDSVGRLGGDEFVVLVDGATMDAGPELVAERLLSVLRAPFELEDFPHGSLTLTASIGIAVGLRPSATELLRDADIALYAAKTAGKDRFVVFQPEMHTVVQDRLHLEMDLRDALTSDQFFLAYQPIFNLRSGETTGVEALLRWRHPDRGVVQPDVFIPVLEDSGMIVEVGRWVLQEACRQGARWHARGHGLDISVNVSARQIETDQLIEDISRCTRSLWFRRAIAHSRNHRDGHHA